MSKHTPGPWMVKSEEAGSGYRQWQIEPNIAAVFYQNTVGEANAHLLAAAPDLLAACKRTLERLGAGFNTEAEAVEYWGSLRAVIAKAEPPS